MKEKQFFFFGSLAAYLVVNGWFSIRSSLNYYFFVLLSSSAFILFYIINGKIHNKLVRLLIKMLLSVILIVFFFFGSFFGIGICFDSCSYEQEVSGRDVSAAVLYSFPFYIATWIEVLINSRVIRYSVLGFFIILYSVVGVMTLFNK